MQTEKSPHVVQIGFDDSVFDAYAPSDTLARQLRYGKALAVQHAAGRMTYIILTQRTGVRPFQRQNVTFLPVFVRRAWHLGRLWRALSALHRELPISLLSPQNVNEIGWLTLIFGKLHAIPVVGQVHYDLFSPLAQDHLMGKGLRGWLKKRVTFFMLPRYLALRVVGEATRKGLQTRGLHYNVRVIPVPVTMLDEPPPLDDLSPQRETQRVLYVGRLSPEKNLGFWLEVAQRVCQERPAVVFDVIGDGEMLAELQEQTQALGIADRVRFLGNIPNTDLAQHYRSADVFLLTSFFEGFGRVLVETCAHGTPVVAPKIHGVEDIILDGKNGFLCPPGDVSIFAEKVLQLLTEHEMRAHMGAWGAKWVHKRFAPQALVEAWLEWLLTAALFEVWLVPPRRVTLKRWWKLSSTKLSLLRSLEYERVDGLMLNGRTLDVGGGQHNSYYHLLNVQGTIESVNIDPSIRPSVIADLNQPVPLSAERYDNFISFNTFEHIYADEKALREAFRMLKPGGNFHIIVPFLYRVHASPSDYHRHTAYWWKDFLISCGLTLENIAIEPLMWDPMATGFALTEFAGRMRGLRKRVAMLPAVIRQLRWRGQATLPRSAIASQYAEYALGYYIHGKKAAAQAKSL